MNLSERCMLSDLSIRHWNFSKLDAKATKTVASVHGNGVDTGRYTKQLVDKAAVRELVRIKGAARTEHYELTLPWLDAGARILPAILFSKYRDAMRIHSDNWDVAVRDFIFDYPALVSNARLALNGLWNPSDYPDAGRIRDKFSFGFNVYPLPDATDFRVNLGAAEVSRLQAGMQQNIDATVSAAVGSIWERMRDVVGHMVGKLRGYEVTADKTSGAFRDSLVENIRDLVAILPALNITGNPNINAFCSRIESELLNYSPQELRDSLFKREETAIRAEDILQAMGDFI